VKADSVPSVNLGIAIFRLPSLSDSFSDNRGIEFSCMKISQLIGYLIEKGENLPLEAIEESLLRH
jgi:hypothetical protein